MSRMADDLAAGFADLQAEAGDPGEIQRGSKTTQLDAIVIGQVNHRGTDSGGQTVIVNRKTDVLIPPSQYCFGGEETLPVMGDQISVDCGISRNFVVVADDSKKCWQYSDGFRTFLRIHVDEVRPR